MKPRGRRYWAESITLAEVSTSAPADNPMGDPVTTITELESLNASVQSLGRDDIIKAQLDSTREHWWVRTITPENEVTRDQTRVKWRGILLKPIHISPGHPIPGEDLELICERDNTTTQPPKGGGGSG